MVSCVVKVLDAIINNVVSGSQTSRTWDKSAASTFDTKWGVISLEPNGLRASQTIDGPKSEPPIPILTIDVIFLPL